ncbi:hypothetical protein [Cryobacterium zhongshanensis]|uniref:Uncharacterized protein n=1 Tax=Cryobacterium zhongshanensis TaxID=2928153 RepID=A0AA41R072_9MICO|nr:hypothetical protein [Cryobacterium zhongshanensis]MCI4659623.1 hypothetical protein [Cryobacterium zhongshanensis]
MTANKTTVASDETPARVYETAYTAVVFDDLEAVLDESYATKSERRDAVVGLLLVNHDEVPRFFVDDILVPFGGANADVALAQVVELYSECGVDVHLGEHLRDAGPAVLYSAFTDYGDGTTFAEHYGSRGERLKELRQRAANLAEGYPGEFFDNADEETCKKVIEYHLAPTNGRLHLFDAKRQDVGDVYITHAPEA